jgi:hypothetical protein
MRLDPRYLMNLTPEELEQLAYRARTSEAHFADRDKFLRYVDDSVNPAREKAGLMVVDRHAAAHLFDVISERRYRQT